MTPTTYLLLLSVIFLICHDTLVRLCERVHRPLAVRGRPVAPPGGHRVSVRRPTRSLTLSWWRTSWFRRYFSTLTSTAWCRLASGNRRQQPISSRHVFQTCLFSTASRLQWRIVSNMFLYSTLADCAFCITNNGLAAEKTPIFFVLFHMYTC